MTDHAQHFGGRQVAGCKGCIDSAQEIADLLRISQPTYRTLRNAVERIASGKSVDPEVEAKVALGELPIASLLMRPDGKLVGSSTPMKGST